MGKRWFMSGTEFLPNKGTKISWLVVWNILYYFHSIGNNHPNWLIFFWGVQTTNQIFSIESMVYLSIYQDVVNRETSRWNEDVLHGRPPGLTGFSQCKQARAGFHMAFQGGGRYQSTIYEVCEERKHLGHPKELIQCSSAQWVSVQDEEGS